MRLWYGIRWSERVHFFNHVFHLRKNLASVLLFFLLNHLICLHFRVISITCIGVSRPLGIYIVMGREKRSNKCSSYATKNLSINMSFDII